MTDRPRIVIVDDSPDDRALEARLLRQAIPGIEVIEVSEAAAWMAVLAAGSFDLVVTDYHLSWSNGLAVLTDVRSRWPERPVVIVTGTGTEEVAVDAMKAGAEDYVLKSRQRIGRLPAVVSGALQRASGRALDRAARKQLELDIDERARVTASLARIEALDLPEETAALVCAEARSTLSLGIVAVDWFIGDDTMILAVESDGPAPVGSGDLLPQGRSEYLRDRASRGPWIEEWTEADLVDPYLRGWHAAGFAVGVYLPLVRHGDLVGLLVGASSGHWSIEEISRRLPALVEYGAIAGAIIEPAMSARTATMSLSADVRTIIANGAFSTVFQPIIGLASNVVGGYEALTRFGDGVSPAIHFANARAAGVSVELELATLGTAVRSAKALPAWAFLSLNVSAELVIAGADFAPLLAELGRPVVLELTEHEARFESPAFTERVKRLGGDVKLAVDDAGAGYSGLRRILDLAPDFVKLDIELVRNIHRDPAREALIAGMVHFARETECSLIAEGIEQDAERRVLRRLGVSFGQGYLLGRPAPAETWVGGAGR
ncbi:MAG: hypothetical protein C0498_00750 [Anaerolinea sp.]|nr:hypothetical protein [Anaerolinea sp.]